MHSHMCAVGFASQIFLSDRIVGYEEMWFIEDNFVTTTYRNNFKKVSFKSYVKDNFELHTYCYSKYNSTEKNLLTRLKVTMAKAVERHTKLLRFVVIILDNDLIQYLAYVSKGIASMLGEWFEWLIGCFTSIFQDRRSLLPPKAVRPDFPQLYFVAPPHHRCFTDNHERKILLNCMEATVTWFLTMSA